MRKVAYILVCVSCVFWALGADAQSVPAPATDPGTLDPGVEEPTPIVPPAPAGDRGGSSPYCDAGGPYDAECEGFSTSIQLNGTGYDPDGGDVAITWYTSCPGGSFDDPNSLTPILTIDTWNMGCSFGCDVELYVEDEDAMSTTCYGNVTITDSTDPTIDVEAQNETVECDGSGNSSDFSYWLDDHGGAEASDLCSEIDDYDWEALYDGLSDDCGETGSVVVEFKVRDECWNSASTFATFTIEDTQDPWFDYSPNDEWLECDPSNNDYDIDSWLHSPEGYDNCSAYDVEVTNDYAGLSGGCGGGTGEAYVMFTATDDCGNFITAFATITVQDTYAPHFTYTPSDQFFTCGQADLDQQIQLWLDSVTAEDEYDCGTVTVEHNYMGLDDGCGNSGSASVKWTATDECGQYVEHYASVYVEDYDSPTWTNTPSSPTMECTPDLDAQIQAWLDSATATDNCGDVTVENNYTGLQGSDCGPTGNATVEWTAVDECDNWAEPITATLAVVDTTTPEVNVTVNGGQVDGNCEFLVTFSATATDNCCLDEADVSVEVGLIAGTATLGTPTINKIQTSGTEVTITGSVLVSEVTVCPAVVSVSVTAIDCCDESVTASESAEVIDDTPPSINGSATDGTVDAECEYLVPFSATITDNCCIDFVDVTVDVTLPTANAILGTPDVYISQQPDGSVMVSGSVLVSDLEGCPATVRVTVDAIDCCDNSATQFVMTADVVDESVPTITCTAGIGDVDANCEYLMPFSATIDDNCCLLPDDVSVNVMLLTGNATLGTPVINKVPNGQGQVLVTGEVLVSALTSCPALVQVTVDAVDCCANPAVQCVAVGEVFDITKPTITCDAVSGEVDDNCEYVMPFSATIDDNCCARPDAVTVNVTLLTGNATLGTPVIDKVQSAQGQVTVTGTVLVSDLTSCPATVEVTVDAVDCCDNSAVQCVTTADVNDVTPPEITCPDDIILERGDKLCNSNVQDWLDSTTATDNCDTDVDIVENSAENGFACGFPYDSTTEVTWTATDDCDNVSECSAFITIKQAPRVDMTRKGSLLIFSKVELRWNAAGELIQDTFLDITNDYPGYAMVQMYFVNGDEPLDASANDRVHLGWNWVDNLITLTGDEPAYWSAASGHPKGVSPFTILDPSDNPLLQGRPANDSTGDRVLRGMVLAWAVNSDGKEIRWNHLKGDALLVHYGQGAAWEYNAWAFSTRCLEQGAQPLDCVDFDANGVCCVADVIPGNLDLDAFQYDLGFEQLIMDFYAVGVDQLGEVETTDTDLTLFPIDVDVRQETMGPVTTKAKFDIWNMNEVKFSGTERCITCWDQELLSHYEAPNHFLREHLQTNKGKARIDGMQSMLCSGSVEASLLGVSMELLGFNAGVDFGMAGNNLFGAGYQSGRIQYDPFEAPPELAIPTLPVNVPPMMAPSGPNPDTEVERSK